MSFPVIVLMLQDLPPSERELIAGHFAGTQAISIEQLFAFLSRYEVQRICMELIMGEITAARRALAEAQDAGIPEEMFSTLYRWTHFVEDVCREKLAVAVQTDGAGRA
jgi:hypothetical protein